MHARQRKNEQQHVRAQSLPAPEPIRPTQREKIEPAVQQEDVVVEAKVEPFNGKMLRTPVRPYNPRTRKSSREDTIV